MIDGKISIDVVLLGPPASGKGTVVSYFLDKYNWNAIVPGDIYRKIRDEDSDLGALVRESPERYHHCPDDLTNRIIHKAVDDCLKINQLLDLPNSRFVFDGYPRSFEQLDYLDKNFNVSAFIHLDAPIETTLAAAINRRYCSGCNKVFSKQSPPKITGPNISCIDGEASRPYLTNTCLENEAQWLSCSDSCAATSENNWITRWDDSEEKYYERISAFNQNTLPVIEAISQRPNYKKFQIIGNDKGLSEIEDWLNAVLGNNC